MCNIPFIKFWLQHCDESYESRDTQAYAQGKSEQPQPQNPPPPFFLNFCWSMLLMHSRPSHIFCVASIPLGWQGFQSVTLCNLSQFVHVSSFFFFFIILKEKWRNILHFHKSILLRTSQQLGFLWCANTCWMVLCWCCTSSQVVITVYFVCLSLLVVAIVFASETLHPHCIYQLSGSPARWPSETSRKLDSSAHWLISLQSHPHPSFHSVKHILYRPAVPNRLTCDILAVSFSLLT